MKRKILIIDDDEAVLEILYEWLTEEDYEVKIYTQIDNIIMSMKEFRPHLVIIDYLLNGINGAEICAQIKSDVNFKNIPVIIFSAFPAKKFEIEHFECDMFIEKPFDLNELSGHLYRLTSAQETSHINL